MSDFDKEAEREKLREKYERDQQERQTTQRMSDLLLKGATMTNTHCGTCGDPLFQMDGTTFCPSCHGNPDAVEGTELEAEPAEGAGDETPATTDPSAKNDPNREPSSAAGGAVEPGAGGGTGSDAPDTGAADPLDAADATAPSSTPHERASASSTAPEADEPTADDAPSRKRPSSGREPSVPSSSPARSGDLGTAHDSLVAALEKFAAEAAETDDPRYARECLEAAREASETLETLR